MSCSDVQTIKAGDGSKLTFSFDFPYIFKSEIHVYFWNVTTKEWDEKLTTDSTYPWQITDANPTIVEFTSTAPPAPTAASVPNEATQDNVRIRRITKVDDIRALFNPGSAIRSNDLNKNFEQLRYAIQESGCQDVPEDLKEYLEEYYWDRYDNTLYDGDTWVSDDTKIASTEAIDDRIDSKINDAITTDIATDGTGITVTDDGDGTITLGLGSSSVDLDRIKDGDIITYAEQNAGSPTPADSNIFTASAAARRFDTLVQTGTPSGTQWETGKTWLQNDDELTLSVWNGSTWTGVASGGTFTNQPKVIYVDASAGDDNNDGHRISRPKLTIKAAISDINSDSTYGDGAIVVVAPGVYQEAAPIQIQKRDVSVIGDGMRNCVIHPTSGTETNTMFEVNSGTYLKNLTFTGMKASGTRGESGSLWEDSTYGLPGTQGWNVAFYAGATIVKSPYIQNCTNFSDSEIDNDDLNFYAGSEDKGRAGDSDSAMTGGGLLIDGSVPSATSPLRSIVCDSYTHVGLDGPGIFVTNNGYAQCTSSYAFFNHFHIACHNGGQANLAASTTDFGRYSLIASGKSPNAIFTSTVDGAASDGATTFNIDAPTAGTDLYGGNEAWFGSATRPQPNMLVEVNSVIYPILSATANGSGWTVEISRPDPNNRSTNLGLNGAISDAAAVNFYLRSMIASSGHTMEYAGSGTDYTALPENGGVPNESREITELDNGKIWTAITNQNGKFRVGGNQTDDPIFEVDQQLGFVTIPEGSIAFNLLSDETPQLGGNLDVNGNTITSTSNANVVIDPNGTGTVDVSTSRITSVTDPTGAQDAATKNYVDTNFNNYTHPNHTGDVTSTGDGATVIADDAVTSAKIADDAVGADQLADTAVTAGSYTSADITVDAQGRITAASSGSSGAADKIEEGNTNVECVDTGSDGHILFDTEGSERMRIDSSGRLLKGLSSSSTTSSIVVQGHSGGSTGQGIIYIAKGSSTPSNGDQLGAIWFADNTHTASGGLIAQRDGGTWSGSSKPTNLGFYTTADGSSSPTERMRIKSDGKIGFNTTIPPRDYCFHSGQADTNIQITNNTTGVDDSAGGLIQQDGNDLYIWNKENSFFSFGTNASERMRIDSSGNVGIGTSSATQRLTVGAGSGPEAILVRTGSGNTGELRFSDTGDDNYQGAFVYNHVSNAMQFLANSAERMRIDSSGRLLVGTSSARGRYTLQLEGNSDSSTDVGEIWLGRPLADGSISSGTGLGKVYFGGQSGGVGVKIEGIADAAWGSSDYPGRLVFSTTADGASSPTERLQIDKDGHVEIKANASGLCRLLFGGIGTRIENATASGHIDFYTNNAVRNRFLYNGQGTEFSNQSRVIPTTDNAVDLGNAGGRWTSVFAVNGTIQTSDSRLKHEVETSVLGINFVKALRPVSYKWIESKKVPIVDGTDENGENIYRTDDDGNWVYESRDGARRHWGFIAQEVKQAVDDANVEFAGWSLADKDDPDSTQSLRYDEFIAPLTKALQEAIAKIETLETKVAALEAAE